MEELQKLMDEIYEWSDATFGKFRTSKAMVAHLKKEVIELDKSLFKYYQGSYSEEIFKENTNEVR